MKWTRPRLKETMAVALDQFLTLCKQSRYPSRALFLKQKQNGRRSRAQPDFRGHLMGSNCISQQLTLVKCLLPVWQWMCVHCNLR